MYQTQRPGRYIVSASFDKTLKVWEWKADSYQELQALTGHVDWVSGCAISADGRTIVSASRDQTLKVWEAHSGVCLVTLHVDGLLYGCACSSDGRRIVAVGARGVYFFRFGREAAQEAITGN